MPREHSQTSQSVYLERRSTPFGAAASERSLARTTRPHATATSLGARDLMRGGYPSHSARSLTSVISCQMTVGSSSLRSRRPTSAPETHVALDVTGRRRGDARRERSSPAKDTTVAVPSRADTGRRTRWREVLASLTLSARYLAARRRCIGRRGWRRWQRRRAEDVVVGRGAGANRGLRLQSMTTLPFSIM